MGEYRVTSFDLKLALLQYFRYERGWICVDEFKNADIVVDTGKEIIEVEVKIDKSDLICGEKKKLLKHELYKLGAKCANHPNKFLFCVPEDLVEDALLFAGKINKNYGIIGFNSESFRKRINENLDLYHATYLRIVKSAKSLHERYDKELRWEIAKRVTSKIITLNQEHFMRSINE